MEIIPPVALDLARYGDEPEYIDQEWVTETYYDEGERVRREFDGVWHSFRAMYDLYSTVGPLYLYNTWRSGWEYLGLAPVSGGYSYLTNDVALSTHPEWVLGEDITASTVRYDQSDNNDYMALVDIDGGDNDIRPSDAVLSDDEEDVTWKRMDAANAWAAIDYSLSTKTVYVDEDGLPLTDDRFIIYTFVSPSANLISAPNGFGNAWTAVNMTVTDANQQAPHDSTDVTADTLTASAGASVSAPGYLWRTEPDVVEGSRMVFAIFVRSANYDSFTVRFLENSVVKTTATFTVESDWRYFQVYHEATSDCTLRVEIGLVPTPTKSLVVWWAHLGYARDAFDRFAVLGAENVRWAYLHLHPWADVEDGEFSVGINADTQLSNSPRNDIPAKSSIIASVFRDNDDTIQTNTGLIYPTDTFVVAVGVKVRDPAKPAAIGTFALGQATTLGGTEWGVESSILSFSRKERDDTFGTVTFVKRGSARQLRATAFIDTDLTSGDEVQQVLSAFDGQPVVWDFNNNGSEYDRLRVFGFHTNVRTLIQATTWESLSIDIEGLVE